jgi:hypothetical protein
VEEQPGEEQEQQGGGLELEQQGGGLELELPEGFELVELDGDEYAGRRFAMEGATGTLYEVAMRLAEGGVGGGGGGELVPVGHLGEDGTVTLDTAEQQQQQMRHSDGSLDDDPDSEYGASHVQHSYYEGREGGRTDSMDSASAYGDPDASQSGSGSYYRGSDAGVAHGRTASMGI